ncbi:MAG: single-stranded-DNA-specific exonuclease RecJ [candidate division Zixibacteria bacterium]|nr:single-stranded-DNA-specific exonuclease RecJ [candidate division Zixibacteria bacterium]
MTWGERTVTHQWILAEQPSGELVDEIISETDLPASIVKVLINRSINTPSKVKAFIDPQLENLADPFILKGVTAGVDRILEAFRRNDKILVYGDYDVDGITSTSLLFLILNRLGAQVDYYLPNRLTEGYGLSEGGILEAKKRGISLIITVDTGITAVEEVKFAKEQGIDVIITDHHEPGDSLPEAEAIINPKQPDCTYDLAELAGVGVAFKLAQALYLKLGQDMSEIEEHLDLVALGTSADIVPLLGENRTLTKFGFRQIARTTKPGLKSLTFVSGLMGKEIGTGQVVFVLAPRINAIGRLGDAQQAVKLLTTRDEKIASEIARKLDSENKRRKSIDETTLREALAQMNETCDLENDKAIVLCSEGWHQGVIGIVASRLVEKYHLPTILIAIDKGVGKGSARSIPGFHLTEALKECEHTLERYGGHKYAAGLTILPEHVTEFRTLMLEVSRNKLTENDLVPKMRIDGEIEIDNIDNEFLDTLETFAPFGPMNMRPIFLTRNLEVVGHPYLVGKNHLKMKVRKGDKVFDVIGFGFGDMVRPLSMRAGTIDMAYVVEYNHWNGVTRIQLRVKDIKFDAGHIPRGKPI